MKVSQVINHVADAYSQLEELKRKVKEIHELRDDVMNIMDELENIPDAAQEIEVDEKTE